MTYNMMKVLFLTTLFNKILPTFRLNDLVLLRAMRRTSQNIGDIKFVPNEVVREPFHHFMLTGATEKSLQEYGS